MRRQHPLSDQLASRFQAAVAPAYFQMCRADVPEVVRTTTDRQTRLRPLLQTECQCAAIGSRRPPDQSRPQQLQASSQSGEFDCPHRAEEPTTQHRLLGVGWPAEDMLHSQEQNSAGWLQNEDYPGDAAAEQGEVQGDRGE